MRIWKWIFGAGVWSICVCAFGQAGLPVRRDLGGGTATTMPLFVGSTNNVIDRSQTNFFHANSALLNAEVTGGGGGGGGILTNDISGADRNIHPVTNIPVVVAIEGTNALNGSVGLAVSLIHSGLVPFTGTFFDTVTVNNALPPNGSPMTALYANANFPNDGAHTTNGDGVAIQGESTGLYTGLIGAAGDSAASLSGQTNVSLRGRAAVTSGSKSVGVYGAVMSFASYLATRPNYVSAAALFDNWDSGLPVLIARTNQVEVARIDSDGTLRANGAGLTNVPEAGLKLTDVTTANASTSAHGFTPKLDNNATHFLNGQGSWTTAAAGLQIFPWPIADPFVGFSNATPAQAGQLGISFLAGQIPYFGIANSTSIGDWRGAAAFYDHLLVGDQTHMPTNGFENAFIVNGCSLALGSDPTNQSVAADAVMSWRNMNRKHYNAPRWIDAFGNENGAIGSGNDLAIGYNNVDFLESYAGAYGFYFVSSGILNGGLRRGNHGDFVWFRTGDAVTWPSDTNAATAAFLIDGATGSMTNKYGSLSVAHDLVAGGAVTLGSDGNAVSFLGTAVTVGDGGTANTGNGSFGMLTLNTAPSSSPACSPTMVLPSGRGLFVDSGGNLGISWCQGTIGTNLFIDAANHEAWITNGVVHLSAVATTKNNKADTSSISVTSSVFHWTNSQTFNVFAFIDTHSSTTASLGINSGTTILTGTNSFSVPLQPGESFDLTYTGTAPSARWKAW